MSQTVWLIGDILCVLCADDAEGKMWSMVVRESVGDLLGTRGEKLSSLLFIIPKRRSSIDTTRFLASQKNAATLLRGRRGIPSAVWTADDLAEKVVEIPPLALHFTPEVIPDGLRRLQAIEAHRRRYDEEMAKLHGKIQFVGMSVYKEESSTGVDIEKIYIPLRVVPEAADPGGLGDDPLKLLAPGERHVILGDPGSGKSTLLRFLALAGTRPELAGRYGSQPDSRLAVVMLLRRYAQALETEPDLDLLNYVVTVARSDFELPKLDREFFEYYLYRGHAILFLDGIDELPNLGQKTVLRAQISGILRAFPGNTVIATSRIVGYEAETRFDSLAFKHHRVARLSQDEIERFVADWYEARIENKSERTRHSTDLTRIFRDPASRAIQELAENPLLLTIICLVHRIDAVLPDERVVLYQKCTETLLNTWHHWKYSRDTATNRGKVERRNRGRMEAIAYWMHSSTDAERGEGRASVPYEILLTFLTEYIEEVEPPSREESLEQAATFLRFVRERAGLLIEVGSSVYSFVHLTFQEYLAASHLRKSGETGGMEVVWRAIKERCGDPRWHEVLRLLVGALERSDSQRYILERVLQEGGDLAPRALLAGGCLLDGVEAAEELADVIVTMLLHQAAAVEVVETLRETIRQLRAWAEKQPDGRESLERLVRVEVSQARSTEELRIGLSLVLLQIGWAEDEVRQVAPCLFDASLRSSLIFETLFHPERVDRGGSALASEAEMLEGVINLWSLTSPGLNRAACLTASLACGLRRADSPVPSFIQLAICLINVNGPFFDSILNAMVLSGGRMPNRRPRTDELTRGKVLTEAIAQLLGGRTTQVLGRAEALVKVRERAQGRVAGPGQVFERVLRRQMRRLEQDGTWVSIEDPAIPGPVLELLSALLNLSPRVQNLAR